MAADETLPTTERLLGLVDGMAGRPVVLLVDLVADRFITGIPKRISREAPVLILSYQGDMLTPGGGANAVANVAALGGRPLPVGRAGRAGRRDPQPRGGRGGPRREDRGRLQPARGGRTAAPRPPRRPLPPHHPGESRDEPVHLRGRYRRGAPAGPRHRPGGGRHRGGRH